MFAGVEIGWELLREPLALEQRRFEKKVPDHPEKREDPPERPRHFDIDRPATSPSTCQRSKPMSEVHRKRFDLMGLETHKHVEKSLPSGYRH